MKPLNKTLMTSAAALIIAAGSAFAQDTSTEVEGDVAAGESVEAEADMSTDVETDLEETAEEAGEAVENTAEDVADAAENTAEDVEQGAEEMAAETEESMEEMGSDVAEGADEMTDEMEGEGEMSADAEGAVLDSDMAAAADMQISSLIGSNVVSQEGNDVGEIDNFVEANGEVMAVIGIGGFLGLGEHDVAIALDRLTVNESNAEGEPIEFMVSGHTEDELKEMQEFDAASATTIDGEMSLRSALGS